MKRIGIFGGSFNPVHLGHILAARAAKKKLGLDQIIFVPCCQSADRKKLMPANLRLKILKAAVKNIPGFLVSDLEIKRGGISRSIDTIRHFKNQVGDTRKIIMIIGEDQAAQFFTWKEALSISKLSKVCVMSRPGFRKDPLIHRKFHFKTVKIPQYEISSSFLRSQIKKYLPFSSLLALKNLSILKEIRNSI